MYSTRCAQDTARDAVQIFGGRGITRTGMGRFIEHVSVYSDAVYILQTNLLPSIIVPLLSTRYLEERRMFWVTSACVRP